MKRVSMMLVLGGVLLAATTAVAAGGMGRGHQGRQGAGPGHGMGFLNHLDLSDAQQNQIDQLRQDMDEDMAPVYAQLDKIRDQIHALWTAQVPDQKKILATMKQLDPLKEKIRAAHVQLRLQVIALLTSAQNQERIKLMARFDKRRQRGERRCPKGPGPDGDLDL